MPLHLYPPRPGKTPNWRIRGTYLGVRIDRTSGTPDKKLAAKLLAVLKADIERGALARPGELTFADAALAYVKAGGETRFVGALAEHFKLMPVASITQADIDKAAVELYPHVSPATRNRQVYSPVSAILKRAGIEKSFKRPAGALGTTRLAWLRPEEAMRLLEAAEGVDKRFGALCTFLLYTGCRLSEAMTLRTKDLNLQESFAYVPQTKNGDPRAVHLTASVGSVLANLDLDKPRVFDGLTKCGRIYGMLRRASLISGVQIPEGVSFHLFRHTYGAWMRRYARLDTSGLVATGAWKSRQAASVYEHADTSEEARKADLLPTAP